MLPTRVVAVVAAVTAGAAGGTAQPPDASAASAPPVLEITTVTRIVDVYAVVADRQGRLVTGLPRDAFELREDGAPQRIELFARETDAPLSLGLVVDTSASQASLLVSELERARAFLDAVLGSGDEAFVMRFDREVAVSQGFTGDRALLSSRSMACASIAGALPPTARRAGRVSTTPSTRRHAS